MKYTGWPEQGELVVGKVDSIEDFGVFIDLEAYEGKTGLVHISEVASGWIKNVRDHVREGQTVVAKVLSVDESSQQIDLSLKDVNDHQRSDTIQAWKNEQKADAWMEIAFGEDLDDDEYIRIAESVVDTYGTLFAGFESAAIDGEAAFADLGLTDDEIDRIVETARDNVSVPYVEVTGYVDLESSDPAGVDVIREALKAAGEYDDEDIDLEVTYVGSPEYLIRVRAPDYKQAEEALEASAERARETIEGAGGSATFHRERHAEAA